MQFDRAERLFSEIAYYVSSGSLSSVHSLANRTSVCATATSYHNIRVHNIRRVWQLNTIVEAPVTGACATQSSADPSTTLCNICHLSFTLFTHNRVAAAAQKRIECHQLFTELNHRFVSDSLDESGDPRRRVALIA